MSVTQAAEVENDKSTVSVEATETLINKLTDFTITAELPLPLNRGCKIDLYIPEPLFIGADFENVKVGGMFGPLRDATFTVDAT